MPPQKDAAPATKTSPTEAAAQVTPAPYKPRGELRVIAEVKTEAGKIVRVLEDDFRRWKEVVEAKLTGKKAAAE